MVCGPGLCGCMCVYNNVRSVDVLVCKILVKGRKEQHNVLGRVSH